MLSFEPELIQRNKAAFFPLVCELVCVRSEEIRKLVRTVLSEKFGPLLGLGQDAGTRRKSSRSSQSGKVVDSKPQDMNDIDDNNTDEGLDPEQLVDDLIVGGEGDEVDKNADAEDIDDKNADEVLQPDEVVDDPDLQRRG